jgi:hypothetical protein
MEDKELNVFEKISLWWRFEGRYYHKDFINGIKNLVRWFPIIWRDRDWDDHYIWQLIQQKLKFQSNYIGKRDFHMCAKRDAEIMMTCVKLIEKIKDEYYNLEYMDYHDTDWEFIDCEDRPGYSELKFIDISENLDEYFKKYPRQYKKVLSGEINLFKRDEEKDKKLIAMEIAHENHQRARKLLFTLLERNIEKWWD